MNIFVGNLSFDSAEADVKKLFEGFGNVASAVIVMEREKKAPKSRGFGFVEMPDEQQALAAIAALNGREFMGRVLNVNPTRNKTEAQRVSELSKNRQPKDKVRAEEHFVLNKPGTYKGGRRTYSYMKRHGLAGMQKEEAKPRSSYHDNPMRWRKREDRPRPWQKSQDEHKPWKKDEEGARPWKKAEGEFKPRRRSEGRFKPWEKPESESKPRKKPAGEPRSWSKSSERPQESRFNPSTSLGMVRGNGERSRTKGRKKQDGYRR